jgi:hypothetical protein
VTRGECYNSDSMSDVRCPGCGIPRDIGDNYCRRCGRQITVNLPEVRPSSLPAEVRTIPPSLIGSVAVLALGTGLEWAARRLATGAAKSAARAAGRALLSRGTASQTQAHNDAAVRIVEEVLYIRQVRIQQ